MFCCFYNACFQVRYSWSCVLKICCFSCLFWIRTRFYGCVLFLVWLVQSTFLPVEDGFLHSENVEIVVVKAMQFFCISRNGSYRNGLNICHYSYTSYDFLGVFTVHWSVFWILCFMDRIQI